MINNGIKIFLKFALIYISFIISSRCSNSPGPFHGPYICKLCMNFDNRNLFFCEIIVLWEYSYNFMFHHSPMISSMTLSNVDRTDEDYNSTLSFYAEVHNFITTCWYDEPRTTISIPHVGTMNHDFNATCCYDEKRFQYFIGINDFSTTCCYHEMNHNVVEMLTDSIPLYIIPPLLLL